MDEYKSVRKYLNSQKMKNKNKDNNTSTKKKILTSLLNKLLVSALLLVFSLCLIKFNPSVKSFVDKNVFNSNISFAKINTLYNKYFGNIFPISGLANSDIEPVFSDKLVYSKKEDYKEGVKLTVGNSYLVPVLESGIVVFIGDKDNYGHVVIVQQVNGIDLWYVGVDTDNLKIYDYIEKGKLLGESSSSEIYLYYQKSGEFLNYKEYFS